MCRRHLLDLVCRFESKDEQLSCNCGCRGCRGVVNVSATEEGEGVVVVPRGELEPWERKEGPK